MEAKPIRTIPKRMAVLVALAITFSAGYALHDRVGVAVHATTPMPVAASALTALPSGVALPDFSAIAAAYGPAVVNISVSGTTQAAALDLPGIDDDAPFSEFFRRFAVPAPHGNGKIPRHGEGSGFIVSPDGVVLTNAHVVAEADEVVVKLMDKREFKAKVVGVDKTTDVAVLRIAAKDLPTVRIGDAQQTRVGEWVLAIGSPFGFENSVTAGIISAKFRTLPDEGYVPFMQTDVAINPGNSGGPLFNAQGEVIGINAQIYSRSGGYQGLSFAIPIDVAMNIEQQLLTQGKVSRGKLGVVIQEVNQGLADSFGLDKPQGALVASVESGSPAAKAGIETGDVILKFNGKSVERSVELPAWVAAMKPGSEIHLEVWRKGQSRKISVKTGEFENATLAKAGDASGASGGKLGLAVRPLTPQERRQGEADQGLLVEEVASGPAARAGIRPGDVIVSINGQPVDSLDRLRSQLDHAGKNVALLVQRGDQRLFVPINLG